MKYYLFTFSNVIKVLIAFYLILTPFLVLPGIGMYDSKRLLQIILLFLTSLCFFIVSYNKKKRQICHKFTYKALSLLSLLLILGILSILFSKFPRYALIEVSMFAVLVLSIVLFSENRLKGHYQLGKFIYIVSVGFASIYLILFFGNFISAYLDPLVPLWPNRLAVQLKVEDVIIKGKEVLYFGNRRFFNHIQTWTFPILISLTLFFKNKIAFRSAILLLLICWWSLTFASGARGTLISFVLACLVLLVLFRKRVLSFISTAVATAVAGFLLYYMMFRAFNPSQSLPVIRMSDTGRFEKWEVALDQWLGNPILGMGPMHYASLGGENYSAHPHNFYLQILAEWGVVALLCFLGLIILYLLFIKKRFLNKKFKFKKLSQRNTIVYMGFMGSAVAGFAHASVSGIFHTPISQIWLILIFSWLISLWNRNNIRKSSISFQRKYLSVIYITLISGLIYLIIPDIGSLDRDHEKFLKENDKAKISPRFWEQGLIIGQEDDLKEHGNKGTQILKQ